MIIYCSGVVSNDTGGFAGIIFHNQKSFRITLGQGRHTSKTEMELYAALESIKLALRYLQKDDTIQLITDSKLFAEDYIKLPAFRRNYYAGLKCPMIWRELHEVMKIAGDRLYIDHEVMGQMEFIEQTRKAAEIARRMTLSDYACNPDSPSHIKRGIQIK